MKKIGFYMLMIGLMTISIIAQSTTGRLIGSVSGPDGLLPGATVTITDSQTGRTQTTVSNASGNFKFERLSFGKYTVKITADGFKSYVANNVKIDANREYTISPKLEVGDVTAEVTIQAGADIVNSSNAELSSTVSPKQVLDLPINGRNPLGLLNLQAGVNRTSTSISGQRSSSVNYTRDGINVQDNYIRTGGFVQDRPTVDDTGEFTVSTQNANASLGNGGSTQVQLITPRGGSGFHGALFEYNRNSKFAANEFGNNAIDVDRPFLNRNQYGGKLSGPLPVPGFGEGTPALFKDKGFFFVSYERFQLNQTSSQSNRILRNQFRDGTFTYNRVDNGNAQTVNLLTGAGLDLASPGNAALFAANGGSVGVHPLIQSRFLGLTPGTGNSTTSNLLSTGQAVTQTAGFNQRNNQVRNGFTMRLDFEINDKNSVYFVHKFNDTLVDRPDADAGFGEAPFANQTSTTRLFNLTWNTVIGSNLSNSITFGRVTSNPFFNESADFPTDFLIGGLPLGLTTPEASFQDQGRSTLQYSIADNASYSKGNHTFRFGFEMNILDIDSVTNFGSVPTYTVNAGNANTPTLTSTLFPGGIGGTDRGIANNLRFLLGGFVGGGTAQSTFVSPAIGPQLGASRVERFEYGVYGLHFSDQWRVTPELTLNLGVRWDYFSPLQNPDQVYLEPDLRGVKTFEDVRTALLDPNGQYVLVGTSAGTPGQFFKPDRNNFAPVLGIAYSPRSEGGFLGSLLGNGKTVIRGGFRMSTINDNYIRSADNSAGGNDGLDFTVNAVQNGSTSLNTRFDNLPGFAPPPFQNPPISFATANANDGSFTNTVFAVDPNIKTQQNMEWSVGIQREIGFNSVIEVRYVGGRSNELLRGFDFNQIDINAGGFLQGFLTGRNNCRIAAATAGRTLDQGCSAADIAGTAGLPGQAPVTPANSALTNFNFLGFVRDYYVRGEVGEFAQLFITNGLDGGFPFRANQNAGNVDLLTNSARYRYNALQLEVRRRFTNGFQFQANYTFQKILSDVGNDSQSRFNAFLDLNNPELEYSRADYDRTHTVNINANYELPFGRGRRFLNHGGWVDKVFGGIQLTSIVNISTGAPISIKYRRGSLNRRGRSGDGTANSNLSEQEIKDLIGIHHQNGIVYYIDPSVIAPNGTASNGNFETTANANFPGQVFFAAAPGQTGSLQRKFINGPLYLNWDAGIIKNIRFGERLRVQLRAEAFNVLNRTNFFIAQNTNTFNIESTTFGQIPTANTFSPRIMQFAFRFEF